MDLHQILQKPVITEKSMTDAGKSKFTFVVAKHASKGQIKQAVEKTYGVKVVGIATSVVKGKTQRVGPKSTDDQKRDILQYDGLERGDKGQHGPNVEIRVGNAMPLEVMPNSTVVHNVELTPGRGRQMARSAGSSATVAAKEENYVHLRMPS